MTIYQIYVKRSGRRGGSPASCYGLHNSVYIIFCHNSQNKRSSKFSLASQPLLAYIIIYRRYSDGPPNAVRFLPQSFPASIWDKPCILLIEVINMHGNSRFRTLHVIHPDPITIRALFLAFCMILGMILGSFVSRRSDVSSFSGYLSDFCDAYRSNPVPVSFSSALQLYFGYTAVAFLMGFSSVGIVFIPLLSFGYGFLSMFSVACFAAVFGREGILMSLAAMGARHLFVIPVFLWMASQSWYSADRLFSLSGGKGKRCNPLPRNASWWYRFCLCVVWSFAGLCVEIFLVPDIFRLILRG